MKQVYEVRVGLLNDRLWKTRSFEKARQVADKIRETRLGTPVIREIPYDPNSSLAQLMIRGKYVEDYEAMGDTNLLIMRDR